MFKFICAGIAPFVLALCLFAGPVSAADDEFTFKSGEVLRANVMCATKADAEDMFAAAVADDVKLYNELLNDKDSSCIHRLQMGFSGPFPAKLLEPIAKKGAYEMWSISTPFGLGFSWAMSEDKAKGSI